jgi:hypothetical protein
MDDTEKYASISGELVNIFAKLLAADACNVIGMPTKISSLERVTENVKVKKNFCRRLKDGRPRCPASWYADVRTLIST